MSFRELRSFCEAMRTLGYPRTVSLDSFRTPNFELVADVLCWLIGRYDPGGAPMEDDISTSAQRVEFVRRVGQLVLAKAHIKLNLKKLYMADGYSVKELLKLANVLRNALQNRDEAEDDDSAMSQVEQLRMNNSTDTRTLASELTEDGYKLHELLGAELKHRDERNRIVSRPPEVTQIERGLQRSHGKVKSETQELSDACVALSADESNLDAKIESKTAQLERMRKRLTSLRTVRPAFMDEYEGLEKHLQKEYARYLEQARNLEYLENELAKYNRMEDALMEEQELKLKVMRERLRKEELEVLRGQRMPDDMLEFDGYPQKGAKHDRELDQQEAAAAQAARQRMHGDDSAIPAAHTRAERGGGGGSGAQSMGRDGIGKNIGKRPRAASGRQRPGSESAAKGAGVRAQGNMYGGDDSEDDLDDDDDDDDDDSDSDGNLSVADDSDSDDSDGDDDEDSDDDDDEDSDDDDDESDM